MRCIPVGLHDDGATFNLDWRLGRGAIFNVIREGGLGRGWKPTVHAEVQARSVDDKNYFKTRGSWSC